MANLSGKIKLRVWIFIFTYLVTYKNVIAGTRNSSNNLIHNRKHQGTSKTILSEDGDIIDCVDIYKQPAFDHSLLQNHTIQMRPTSYSNETKQNNSLFNLFREKECHEGSIPIIRTNYLKYNHEKAEQSKTNVPGHEYAQVSLFGTRYFGTQSLLNVWNPTSYNNELSLSQVWVTSGPFQTLNSIEAGWMVTSSAGKEPRFFIYWTVDGYKKTGCYNLLCPGFVQTNHKFALYSVIEPVSTYGGKQMEISIKIHKDMNSGNWWLRLQDQELGYWPNAIFTNLKQSADQIIWGGEITNHKVGGHHTSTKMGSGHFASEGQGKASYHRNIKYIDNNGASRDPEVLKPYASNPSCYDVKVANKGVVYGTYFFFGGPGFSRTCP